MNQPTTFVGYAVDARHRFSVCDRVGSRRLSGDYAAGSITWRR